MIAHTVNYFLLHIVQPQQPQNPEQTIGMKCDTTTRSLVHVRILLEFTKVRRGINFHRGISMF